jgi:hypothetical protein
MLPCASAARFNSELPAKASIASATNPERRARSFMGET